MHASCASICGYIYNCVQYLNDKITACSTLSSIISNLLLTKKSSPDQPSAKK